jgi:hypothetical protein
MHIPPEKVEDIRTWFKARGGVVLWSNQEIGVSRPEMMTPATHQDGSPASPPHWAYGNPVQLKPEEIGVRTETKVEPPLDWFPVCDVCNGTGRRALQEIATARGVTVADLKNNLEASPEPWTKGIQEDDTFDCWHCQWHQTHAPHGDGQTQAVLLGHSHSSGDGSQGQEAGCQAGQGREMVLGGPWLWQG